MANRVEEVAKLSRENPLIMDEEFLDEETFLEDCFDEYGEEWCEWRIGDEIEEMTCLGLINTEYREECEFCVFREVCEDLAQGLDEEGNVSGDN